MFVLDPQLELDSLTLGDLPLCRVLLMDNRLFPWLLLVPRQPGVREIVDLPLTARHMLMDEIALVSQAMQALFAPDKLNVAALGNQVPQLHMHMIARFLGDAAWPNPVWSTIKEPYPNPAPLIAQVKAQLGFPA